MIIIHFLGVTTYVVMPAYTGFREFLESITRTHNGQVLGEIGQLQYFGNHISLKIHESVEIYEF